MVRIDNEGPEITYTNYFDSDRAARGYVYLSPNAGAFRLLVPDPMVPDTSEWPTAREIIISRGPWPEANQSDALEILFEDDTDNPYVLKIASDQAERMPLDTDRDRPGNPPRWKFSAWTREGKVLELPCRYRLVKRIPWMKAWNDEEQQHS